MRINCVICTDLFVPSSNITVTECGHIFHSHCIFQWLERSKTCPQCRRKTQEKKLVKIFLDCCESSGDGPEPSQLQNELENVRFKLTLKISEVRKALEEGKQLRDQHTGLREEVKKLEKACRDKDDTVTALKMQLQCLSQVAREKQRAIEERDKLKSKLRLLSNVDAVVSQSTEEVSQMLAAYSSDEAQAARDMATYCLMLKKELERSLGERRKFSDDRHQLRAQLLTVKGDGQRLQRTMEKLKSQNGTLEAVSHSLEEENERLRKQKMPLQKNNLRESIDMLEDYFLVQVCARAVRKLAVVSALEAAVVSPSGDPRNSALTRLLTENVTPAVLRRPEPQPEVVDITSPPEGTAPPTETVEDADTPRLALRGLQPPAPASPPLRVRAASVAARLGRHPAAPAAAAVASRTPVDCGRMKGKNLLRQNPHRADFAASVAAPGGGGGGGKLQKRAADHGWDGLGGSSRPDLFPGQQGKLKVRLKTGGQVIRIDNFFTS